MKPYEEMSNVLKQYSTTNIELYFQDAVMFDYSKLDYDAVFTSPPYYFKEIYGNSEKIYKTKKEMD